MAGTRVDMPINGAADWSNFVDIVQLMMESYFSVSLTNMEATTEPLIESIGFAVIKGTVYKFTSDETITGWAGLTLSTEAYIYLVPAGASVTAIWSNTVPTWDSDYQGYYNGNDRCIGGAYKDGSSLCTKKWLGYNSARGDKGSQTNRERIVASDIGLSANAGDVDADVMPLGTSVTSSPTGGTATNLTAGTFVRAAIQEVFNRLKDLSGVANIAVKARHIDFSVNAGDVDADILPLGTIVSSSPTGGTATSLPAASFVRAALQLIFDRFIALAGVQNDAVIRRHLGLLSVGTAEIDWGAAAGQVDLDDVPESTTKKHLTTAAQSIAGAKTFNEKIILSKGLKPTNSLYQDNITENEIFDALAPSIPNTDDEVLVTGGYYNGTYVNIVSRAIRTDVDTISLISLQDNGNRYSFGCDDGSASTVNTINIAW